VNRYSASRCAQFLHDRPVKTHLQQQILQARPLDKPEVTKRVLQLLLPDHLLGDHVVEKAEAHFRTIEKHRIALDDLPIDLSPVRADPSHRRLLF
jgi:hypothetical protein